MVEIKKPKLVLSVLATMAFLAIFFATIYPALAAPPGNDDISFATTVFGLPYYDYIDTSEATVAGDDPFPSCNYNGVREATVWYQYTPMTDTLVTASTAGSSYTANLAVYTGSPGMLSEVTCVFGNYPVGFQAVTGENYYIMIAAADGGSYPYPYPSPGSYGGWLNFSLDVAPQPVAEFDYWNDPYSGQFAYYFNNWSYDPAGQGMWAYWDFGDGTTSTDWSPFHQFQGEGSYLVSLTVTTYDGRSASTQRWVDAMILQPVADFYFYPYDPSTFDQVHFENWSYDPSCWGCGLSASWDFGDGTTSTEWSPSHQYAADGDYTVSLTVTAADGRTAYTNRILQVRTHDVAITKFTVPQAAKAGQTRSITVEINNTHNPEEVLVELYKSTASGWQWVGSLQQSVPVRPANRTTSFKFSYTFTAEDAQLGRINFRAVASIVNGRDALPTNNEAISLPTKVAP